MTKYEVLNKLAKHLTKKRLDEIMNWPKEYLIKLLTYYKQDGD